MTKIKICGIKRKQDIAYVNECNPDYIGFVFAKSKREISKEEAIKLRKLLNDEIIPVGVFVNEKVNIVANLLNDGIIEVAQLHGDENAEYIKQLYSLIKKGKIVKTVSVSTSKDIESSRLFLTDYLLFDTYSATERGGTGKTFEWNLLKKINRPFFLAGGIHIDNVEAAVKMINPYAIDISSAVEKDGQKDRLKIIEIVNKVKMIEIK